MTSEEHIAASMKRLRSVKRPLSGTTRATMALVHAELAVAEAIREQSQILKSESAQIERLWHEK